VLFDFPRVIDEARDPRLRAGRLQPGDFFQDALPVCGAYGIMESDRRGWRRRRPRPDARNSPGFAFARVIDTGAGMAIMESVVP